MRFSHLFKPGNSCTSTFKNIWMACWQTRSGCHIDSGCNSVCQCVCAHLDWTIFIWRCFFFSNRVAGRFPRRKSVSASALQSHLEFIGQPNPGSCLFFPLWRGREREERERWRRMEWSSEGGGLMREKVRDIREDRWRMEVGLGKRKEDRGAGVAQDCFHSPTSVASALFALSSIWDTQDNKWCFERLPLESLVGH